MLIPVILSGGAGTRLWPVSREAHPKPFLKLADGQSLLQKALLRAAALPDVVDILTVTNRDYYFQTRDEYDAIAPAGISTSYLLEPFARNTAPAVIAAALFLRKRYGNDALLLVLPSDHLITRADAFVAAVGTAAQLAARGDLVTFGVEPACPETGYGYIEKGDMLGGHNVFSVARFIEKPRFESAQRYVSSGQFLWNSGMFCFAVGDFLNEAQEHAPLVLEAVQACMGDGGRRAGVGPDVFELDQEKFRHAPDISIDYAIMEKSRKVSVVACNPGWSDVGSWNAISELVAPDESGNRVIGEAFLHDVKNCYIQADGRLVGAIGIENLVVVDTPDALLLVDRDRVQEVRDLAQRLKQSGHETYRLHRTAHRPWGTYTVLEEGGRFKIKRIVVKPGASLSLQMHHHRSEHWIVVSGMAKVVNGEREMAVNTNESTYIPAGHKHRLENPGVIDLVMIEVQVGDYLGEDDIVRFQDNYGRA